MKFGGTSMEDATAIDRVAGIVKLRLPERPFVVVSAMAKVTDQLLAMAAAAGRGEREQALDICRHLRERHYMVAGELLGTGLHTELHSELGEQFDSLDELLRGIAAVGELTPRTSDYVVSFGERLFEHDRHRRVSGARHPGDFSRCASGDHHRLAAQPRCASSRGDQRSPAKSR